MVDFTLLRQNMLIGQVIPGGITDTRILRSIGSIRREDFVPSERRTICYSESVIFLNQERSRFLLPPLILTTLIQSASIKENETVLDVACGTGYSSLILRSVTHLVVGIESDLVLLQRAKDNCSSSSVGSMDFFNVEVTSGWPPGAPYDVIFIGGCVEEIPDLLWSQLGEDGRLVTIFKRTDSPPRGVIFAKSRHYVTSFDAPFLPIPEFMVKNKFSI